MGNKCDLTVDRQVELDTASAFADRLGVQLLETSAKMDVNIERLFNELALELKVRLGEPLTTTTSGNKQTSTSSSFKFNGTDCKKSDGYFSQCCGTTGWW